MAAALFEPLTAELQVRLLHPAAVAPRRAHDHDAGYDLAGDLEREDTSDGVRIRARVPAAVAPRFERFSVNGTDGEPE
jgi:GTP-binding protein HflX